MRAVRVPKFGEPEVMTVEDVPEPSPSAGQVLVAIEAAGVNPVDTYIRAGWYPPMPVLPYTPGWDGAGTVERVGPGVTRFAPGDRVFTWRSLTGTYAEKALCAEEAVHPLPARVGFEEGAAVGVPYATAFRALFQRAGARPGERVLVHGASGGVGLAAVQMAAAAGLEVFGTAGSAAGRALVQREGAHHVFDHGEAGYLARAKERTGGRGFDVILEMLANVNLGKDLEVLAPRGRVVVIGSRGKVEIAPRDLMGTDGAVLGMRLPNARPEEMESIFAAVGAGLANGTLRPVVFRRFGLEEAARAHHEVMEAKLAGKIVLLP
jgi:NADPH2:quinone reductase